MHVAPSLMDEYKGVSGLSLMAVKAKAIWAPIQSKHIVLLA